MSGPEPPDPEPPPVELAIDGELDLHAFAPRDVVAVVDAYLEAAFERGLAEVRLVHGKGRGVQRAAVQRRLRAHPLVEGFADAPPGRGGWGATLVRLHARGAGGQGDR